MRKKLWKKRYVAGILALVLSVTSIGSAVSLWGTSAKAAGTELTVDGESWQNWVIGSSENGLYGTIGNDGDTGAASVIIPKGKSGGYQVFETYNVVVSSNTTYDISYYVNQKNTVGTNVYFSVYDGGNNQWLGENASDAGAAEKIIGLQYVTSAITDWTKVTGKFTTSANTSYVTIRLSFSNGPTAPTTDAEINVKDLKIVGQAKNLGNTGGSSESAKALIFDGTTWDIQKWAKAENGLTSSVTTGKGDAYAVTANVQAGSVVHNHVFLETYNVAVDPNTEYDISYYVSQENIASLSTFISVYDTEHGWTAMTNKAGTTANLAEKVVNSSLTGWQHVTGDFVTGADTKVVVIRVMFYNTGLQANNGFVKVDDLQIKTHVKNSGSAGQNPTDEVALTIPDFKDWAMGQSTNGLMGAITTPDDVSGSAMVVAPQGSTAGKYQIFETSSVTVTPDTVYDISYQISQKNMASLTAWISVYDIDNGWTMMEEVKGNGPKEDLAAKPIDGSLTGWSDVTGTFVTGDNTNTVAIRVMFYNTGTQSADGFVKVDNLTITAREPEPVEKFFDGGFESVSGTTLNCWTNLSPTSAIENTAGTVAHSGNHSLQYKNVSATQAGSQVESVAMEVKPDTTYDISYFLKNVDFVGATGYISVLKAENGEKVLESGSLVYVNGREDMLPFYIGDAYFGTDWQQKAGQFTTDEDTTEIIVRFTVHTWAQPATVNATLYVDDIEIKEVEEQKNGTFEIAMGQIDGTPIDSWTAPGSSIISVKAGKEGHGDKSSLMFENANAAQGGQMIESEVIEVEPNTTYDLSYFMKNVDYIGATGYVGVRTESGTWLEGREDLAPFYIGDAGYGTEWQEKTTQFTTDADTTKVVVRFTVHTWAKPAEEGARLFVDDLKIAKVAKEAINNGALDGSFERVYEGKLVNWISGSADNGILALAGDKAHEGESSLQFTSPTTTLGKYQQVTSNVIKLKPNTTYDLSYYVKNKDFEGATGYVGLVKENGEFVEGKEDLLPFFVGEDFGSAWKRLEYRFTTDNETEKVYARFTIHTWASAPKQENATLYIDEFVLEEVPTNGINDGSFDASFEKAYKGKLTNWKIESSANKVAVSAGKEAHTGTVSAQFTSETTEQGYQTLTSNVISLEPNTSYDISYYRKSLEFLGATGYVSVIKADENGQMLYDVDGKPQYIEREDLAPFYVGDDTFGTDWGKSEGTFTTDAETNYIIIRFSVHTWAKEPKAGATLYIDDVVIEKSIVETTLIKNPDFERTDLKSWIVLPVPMDENGVPDQNIENNMSGTRVGSGQHGDYALRMQADVYGFLATKQEKDIEVKPGTTYKLTYYVRTENAENCDTYVQLRMIKEDGSSALGDYKRAGEINGNQSEWKKVTYYLTTAEDQTKLNLELVLSVSKNFQGKVPAAAYFDNFTLEETETLTPYQNLGFEYVEEESLRDFTWQVGAMTAEELALADKSKYGWSLETEVVHEGKQAVRLTSKAAGAFSEIHSPYLPINGGSTYEVRYWVYLSGSETAKVSLGFNMIGAEGKPASTEWYWAVESDVTGITDGWKKVTAYVTLPADAAKMDLRFLVSGGNTDAILDEITLTEMVDDGNQNLDFESGMHNWMVTGGEANIDNTIYHGGKSSLHITKNGTKDTKITAVAKVDASLGQSYLFGGYIKSCNNINTKIRINLNCYDANGSYMKADTSLRVMLGRAVPLNADEEASEWQRLMIAVPVPDDTAKIGFEIVISEGQAEVWVDDLFYRVCNLSADETLVDYTTVGHVDNEGNMDSWSLEEVNGSASFTMQESYGKLVVADESEAYMVYDTDYLLSGDNYHIVFRDYTASNDATAIVKYFDYKGNYLEGLDTSETLPASSQKAEHVMKVTVPSSTTAKIYFGAADAGTYTLDQIDTIEVYEPDASQSWLGRWIWYNEDSLTAGQYATRYFRHTFTLEEEPTYAPLQISVDDNYTVYVNGAEVGSNMGSGQDQWQAPQTYDILRYLKKGENVIAIEAHNLLSYGGLVYDARVTMESGEVVRVCSNMNEVVTSRDAADGWTDTGFTAFGWIAPKEIGVMGVSPWGSLYFNSALYAENKIEITSFEAGETMYADSKSKIEAVITVENEIKGDFPFEVQIYRKNSTKQITSAVLEIVEGKQPSEWKQGENKVVFEMYVPDYLNTGHYTLQLSDAHYYLTNEDVVDRQFANITVLQSNEKQELPTAEMRQENGKPTIYVNGEAKAPLFYLSPAGDLWWDLEQETKYCEGSDTEFYVTNTIYLNENGNKTEPIWVDENTIDYDTFDRYIYEVLSADSDALLVVNVSMQAPDWWLDQNLDQEILIYDAKTGETNTPATRAVSFSSEKYREEAGEVLEKLIKHMKEASYASHVVGIKIQDGETQEYMTEGVEDWKIGDMSQASLEGFRKYLKSVYETEEALQEAYGNKKVTFDNVTIPTWDERSEVWLTKDGLGQTSILDPANNRITIDYNYYLGKVTTETFLHYAQIIKETSDNKLLAGAYHGYVWAFASPAGAGSTHPAIADVLNSEYVDFICSPFIYGERDKGENAAYDAMLDGVQAAGKLYILEVDTRSVFETATGNADWDADVGYCYTMKESIQSLKRDIGGLIAKGAGFWIFNMYGSWWYDDQMLDYIKDVKEEMYFNTYIDTTSASDIAVFVDDMMYSYTAANDVYGTYEALYFLFNQQRRNLGTIGAGYDTYNMSDLVNNHVVKDYKVYVMLSPYEITPEEETAIRQQLMKDGKTILWIYLPGLSDGKANNMKNITDLTGFEVGYVNKRGLLNGIFKDGHALTESIEGYHYGNDLDSILDSAGPLPYIDLSGDSRAIELAECAFDDSKTAMAMKDMGDWTSIYSTVMNLPAGFFRNLLEFTGGHVYSDNASDIVHASDHYLSVYSMYGGERTITLPEGKTYSVYDVYEEEYVTMNENTFTFDMEDNSARLFRLMSADKVAVLSMTNGGHVSLNHTGVTELSEGEDFKVHATVEDGYELVSVKVDGEEVEVSDTVTLQNVEDTHSIVFETKQVKTYGVFYDEIHVQWGKAILLVLGVMAAIAVVGIAGETIWYTIRRKKKQ